MLDKRLRATVLVAAFSALIVVGAILSFPSPWNPAVPFTLATMFVILAGVLLGPWLGMAAVGVYLLLGLVGLPVFSQGNGGPQVLIGPTGGFLIGYLVAAFVGGFIARLGRGHWVALILAVLAATLAIYVPGLPWMHRWLMANQDVWTLKQSWIAITPFFIGDAVKGVAAVLLARVFWGRLLPQDSENR